MIDEIINAVSTVGFPIACCVVMFNQQKELQQTLAKLSETLTSMNERISHIEDKIEER